MEANIMRIGAWIGGLLGAAVLGVFVSGWWHAAPAAVTSRDHSVSVTAAQAANPASTTWSALAAEAPSLTRIPTWLPSGAGSARVYRDATTGTISAFYSGPQGAWTVLVQEIPGISPVSNPHETTGTLAGRAVTLSQWTASSGTPLTDVDFTLGGNTYDILGMHVSMTTVEHVAQGLMTGTGSAG
jgi:hypothetical protein